MYAFCPDYIGLDTHKMMNEAWKSSGDPDMQVVKGSHVLDDLVSKGHMGKKSGKGFYDYSRKKTLD